MFPEAFLAVISGLAGVIIGAGLTAIGLFQTSRRDAHLRRLPFLTKQMELCFEASQIAATLATTRSQEDFDRAHTRFLELFWGPLSIVENQAVSDTMVKFREQLNGLLADGAQLPLRGLEDGSYELAIEVRQLIQSWKITNVGENIKRDPT